jgi:uncharacterized protein (TIGR02453 family)
MQAAPIRPAPFTGFRSDAFELLRLLGENNDRRWFAAHRPALESLLVRPALALVIELGPVLRRRVSPHLRAEPSVGGSLLRLQHDARHVRAKPFRTHLELWFWEGEGPSRDHPGCFVRLMPERLVLGAGITTFPADRLDRYRDAVDAPRSGRALVALLHRLTLAGWSIEGSCLRRVPRPYPADHERAHLLRRRGLRVERSQALPAAVFGPQLPELLAATFSRLRPLHHWLVGIE